MIVLTKKDKEVLRELARKKREIHASAVNQERIALWKRHHAFQGERPVIHIEINPIAHEIIHPLLKCEHPVARSIEEKLYRSFINITAFDDDMVVSDDYPILLETYFIPFNIDIITENAPQWEGIKNIGHHFKEVLVDLEDDWHLLHKSRYGIDWETTRANKELAEDIFGDILPVRYTGTCQSISPTQNIVHIMSMENIYLSMYDYPELFHKMMQNLTDDYLEYLHFLETEKALLPTTGFEFVGQSTRAFNDVLKKSGDIQVCDIWGFMESQETVGISPKMFKEFIFPYYKKVSEKFGLLSYGCCEPIDPIWEYIQTFENLRKVSISPWCNQQIMGEQLAGKNIIYHRKPSSNFLGLGVHLDEDAFRAHIQETLFAAKDCHLEITQRDVYTVHHSAEKVHRYVEIIREEIDKHWNA